MDVRPRQSHLQSESESAGNRCHLRHLPKTVRGGISTGRYQSWVIPPTLIALSRKRTACVKSSQVKESAGVGLCCCCSAPWRSRSWYVRAHARLLQLLTLSVTTVSLQEARVGAGVAGLINLAAAAAGRAEAKAEAVASVAAAVAPGAAAAAGKGAHAAAAEPRRDRLRARATDEGANPQPASREQGEGRRLPVLTQPPVAATGSPPQIAALATPPVPLLPALRAYAVSPAKFRVENYRDCQEERPCWKAVLPAKVALDASEFLVITSSIPDQVGVSSNER